MHNVNLLLKYLHTKTYLQLPSLGTFFPIEFWLERRNMDEFLIMIGSDSKEKIMSQVVEMNFLIQRHV